MGKFIILKFILGIVKLCSGVVLYKGKEIGVFFMWKCMCNDIVYVLEGWGMFYNLIVKEYL